MRVITITTLAALAISFSGCQGKKNQDVVDETYVHRYGVKVQPDEWSSRGKFGKVISRMNDGTVVTRNYKAGELDGQTTYTFKHSDQIEVVHDYEYGELIRELVNYRTGKPKREIVYEGNEHRRITEWYEDGTPKSQEDYQGERLVHAKYFNEGQQIESRIDEGKGTRLNRDQYGILNSTDEIAEGDMVLKTVYHPNGAPREMVPYQHGVISGSKRTFNPGGDPYTIEEWDNDERHGITVVYENGEKLAEIPYSHGKKNGVEQRFRNGDKVVERINWKNDLMHGPRITYIGDKQAVQYYFQGDKVSKTTYDRMTRGVVVR